MACFGMLSSEHTIASLEIPVPVMTCRSLHKIEAFVSMQRDGHGSLATSLMIYRLLIFIAGRDQETFLSLNICF